MTPTPMPEANEQLERGRFEGEVLARLTSLDAKLDSVIDSQGDHETRLRSLEDHKAKEKGKALAVGAIAGGLIQVVSIAVQWLSTKQP